MKKIVGLLSAVGALVVTKTAYAVSFYDPAETLGLGSADLQETVIAIIQWILGLLGLIAVIMILIGGFKWMTAGGNEEKIESAKKLLTSAIIGLVIVLLAWAIVIFALGVLQNTSGVT
ncbi:pilin [Patescibacteria group bacterium]|nr:pilin [Patescibacteria group bacterium]MBU1074929.1 pilin [Patescibacteria group bacterium]MBU1951326.1 pilin [Patescibacteria group bacterium]MBU2228952.1 pilin [Patescibacteria group bacterium]MBU2235439.1 pilin [Patescibacteria group bacterium]